MASSLEPKIQVYKADGAIPKGSAVKYGSDKEHVAKATAATDKIIGIAQSVAAAAEDLIEVAKPGGGGKALAGGSISGGDLLTADTNGALIATTTATNRWIAVAQDGASSGDIVSVDVCAGLI